MGTFEELPIELQISIMEYAWPKPKKLVRKKKAHLKVMDVSSYIEYIVTMRTQTYQLTVCGDEAHTPTSSYLKYDNGWLQTVYDFNNNAYEPNLRIACDY